MFAYESKQLGTAIAPHDADDGNATFMWYVMARVV